MIDNIEETQSLTKDKDKLFHPKFELVRMIILVISLIFTYVILSGCAEKQERIVYKTVYQDVYVPVKCDAQTPARPQPEANPALATVDIIEYARELEVAFRVCVGE